MPGDDLDLTDITSLDPIAPLLQKRLLGETLSAEDLQQLDAWRDRSAENKALFERLEDPAAFRQMLKTWHGIEKNRELNKQRVLGRIAELVNKTGEKQPNIYFLQKRFLRYAAAIIILLGAGTLYWVLHNNINKDTHHALATTVIGPGHNGAILTLADGSQVVLDSLGNGVVANQHGAQVSLQNGQLAYATTNGGADEVVYNTVSTPKGRQFRLLLPDGSKVWLNAGSSVKYPTTFTGAERRVELEGEAYFEVAKNEQQPFKVAMGNATEVEVLGTNFNINSYKNEASIKTTLLEGAVRFNAYRQSQILAPGQQVVANPATAQLKVIRNVDLDQVMAWKNGLFDFDDASLEEIMRQLERWYDIEVIYPKGIPDARFGGEINKQNTLQDVLQILEKSNVHFRLEEGRRLVVLP